MTRKEPKTIKRYHNRKLYDTQDSCYVTLEEIGEMVKLGEDVRVIDNASKEDITAMTLAQIIFEEQKRKTNVMPLNIFTHLLRSGGDALKGVLAKTLESGVREMSHVREFVDEKIKPTIENVQHLPELQDEIAKLKNRIEALEQKIRSGNHPK